MNEGFYVLSFETTSHSIQTEQKALRAGLAVQVIPTPREITANCGMALRVAVEEEKRLWEFFHSLKVPCSLYRISPGSGAKTAALLAQSIPK